MLTFNPQCKRKKEYTTEEIKLVLASASAALLVRSNLAETVGQ
jgi:hypothetical protein